MFEACWKPRLYVCTLKEHLNLYVIYDRSNKVHDVPFEEDYILVIISVLHYIYCL